ncbi:MAG: thiamine-phosphate kinase, partial [Phreatobacter sp.]|nr:thiamine-phosphate kinase [Phreatobacter sp.]
MTRPSEDDLIARFFAPLATTAGADGLTDDAAVIPEGAGDLVVTKDMAIAGVHFFPDDPPDLIAAKVLRVNLSDLAAKGAVPVGFLLGLGLPPDWTTDFLAAFATGLGRDIAAYDCPLLGGDTVKVPGPLTLSVTAFGRAARTVRRRGARPGDVLCVTGTIGDGALGLIARQAERAPGTAPDWLRLLAPEERAHLVDRYLAPRPRTTLAAAVARYASSAMDVSDGLVGDLAKMMAASAAGARLDAAAVPLSPAAARALA